MAATEQLALLKTDLGMYGPIPDALETYLKTLLFAAGAQIAREGVTLEPASIEDDALIAAHAAWLYRKRASDDAAPLSKMIRRQLNDRLVAQNMSGVDG